MALDPPSASELPPPPSDPSSIQTINNELSLVECTVPAVSDQSNKKKTNIIYRFVGEFALPYLGLEAMYHIRDKLPHRPDLRNGLLIGVAALSLTPKMLGYLKSGEIKKEKELLEAEREMQSRILK